MVESTEIPAGYEPNGNEKILIAKYLESNTVIIDPGFSKSVTLLQTEAEVRSSTISDVEYDFQLCLNRGEYYIGNAVINFFLDSEPAEGTLFVNLVAMAISSLVINDNKCTEASFYQNHKIPLDMKNLSLHAWNTVQVRYFSKYNTNCTGLHTFTDLKDQNQYLYSQFEAFHCHKVFPCFDQPDLKAKMTLVVTVPNDWQAVSNTFEKRYEKANGDGLRVLERHNIDDFLHMYEDPDKVSVYEFQQTTKISPYLYAICAGPYHVFEDYDAMHVPQRIFIRQSLKDNMRHELVFGVSKTTIDFYQKNFGQRYPFQKVDHVMCPDYKYGAMENVGCITYADSIMCAQKHMSIPQLVFFVVVIQHELCHMWFGNLVTMKWWNDLWLNEAFATSLSYYACSQGGAHVDEFKHESWIHMAGYKRWGLQEDLMPSNHKIQADCPSTDTAESLIDGVTYGKGSAMIKQLIFLMGWESFTHGLKIYFKRHAWGNTGLEDFIGALQDGFNEKNQEGDKGTELLDLNEWARVWLQTIGCNEITGTYTQKDNKFEQFTIVQTPAKNSEQIERKQCLNIGLYDEEAQLIETIERVYIQSREKTIVDALAGKDVPAAILINNDDWGFGYFILDDASIRVFENKLSQMENPLNRVVIIGQIISMVRQLAYPATRLPIIMNQLTDEKNQNLINAVWGQLLAARSSFLPQEAVPKFNYEVAAFFFKKALHETDNESLQMFCIDKAVGFITEKDHLKLASSWIFAGKIAIEGQELPCTLTDEHKYSIVKQYNASQHFSADEKKELLTKAFETDDSDAGKTVQRICDYNKPDEALKEQLWEDMTNEASRDTLIETKNKVQGFFQRSHQLEMIKPYFSKFYEVLPGIVDKRDREFAEIFMNNLSPAFMAREEDEVAFKAMLDGPVAAKHDFFALFLKKQLENISTTQKSRTLCETYKTD